MKTTVKKERMPMWSLLSKATGYSSVYCRKVVDGDRSQTSKGGKIIMDKYVELQKVIFND